MISDRNQLMLKSRPWIKLVIEPSPRLTGLLIKRYVDLQQGWYSCDSHNSKWFRQLSPFL